MENQYDEYEETDQRGEGKRRTTRPPLSDPPSSTIMLRDIPSTSTEPELYATLQALAVAGGYEPPTTVRVPLDKSSGMVRGFAFVDFTTIETAIHFMDGHRGALNLAPDCSCRMTYCRPIQKSGHGGRSSEGLRKDWLCNQCNGQNFSRRTSCYSCNAPRPLDPVTVDPSVEVNKGGHAASTVLIVRNLDPYTSDEAVLNVFTTIAPVKDIRLIREKGSQILKGYGFIEFHTVQEAALALSTVTSQPLVLDGRALQVSFGRGKDGPFNKAGSDAIAAGQALSNYDPWKQATPPLTLPGIKGHPTLFTYDATSGYYFDINSGFYYDTTNQLYYSNGQYHYYDPSKKAILPYLLPDTTSTVSSNSATVTTDVTAPALVSDVPTVSSTEPAATTEPTAEPAEPIKFQGFAIKQTTKTVKRKLETAVQKNVSHALEQMGKKVKIEAAGSGEAAVVTLNFVPTPTVSAPVIDVPATASGIEAVARKAVEEKTGEAVCFICQRKFPSYDLLRKHEQMSDLHKSNVARMQKEESDKAAAKAAAAEPEYRDRARERRQMYGQPNKPEEDDGSGRRPRVPPQTTLVNQFKSSAQEPIAEDNKGSKMLKGMGWTEGEGLGKDRSGITAPITAKAAVGTAGLGSGPADARFEIDPTDSYKTKAQKTFWARYGDDR
eukprot:GILJ01006520.1.p1 GENE.GILJ01006520.1~~GILJ01006520.1.p1  ORF type:complete len:664 (-),score=119.09 GILJ01006520.1:112-2103(-)